MNRSRSSEPLTVAELVRCGPLARAGSFATRYLDRPVTGVLLISELEKAQRCEPNTALVVHPAAAHGIWALESVLRHAWERNASCVVAPAEITVTSSTIQLAERLRIPLFTVADPAQQALELAAAIADTEAARARLMARCAVLFGEHGRLRDIIGVINTEVPGVSAALITEDGHLLAGRSAAGRPDNEESSRVRVAVPGPDGRPWATLVAQLAAWSPSWVETVETILRLARAPLVASVAGLRLSLAQQASKDRLLLETLLQGAHSAPGANGAGSPFGDDATTDPRQLAREAGWRVEGTHVAVALRPADPDASAFEAAVPVVVAAWQEAFPYAPIVPRGDRWVAWFTDEAVQPREVAEQVGQKWASARLPIPLAVGIGRVGEGMDGIRRSVGEAELAATAAGQLGGGPIELYDDLGPRAVLACLPVADVATAARVLLADLIADPKADVLITTLVTLLDCGGSTGQAAARLGLHRNTMLGRIERIRACGVDLESPDQRLALHVACYTLLNT